MRALPILFISAVALAGCGGGTGSTSTAATAATAATGTSDASASALAGCAVASGSGPASAFPAGLLPSPSKITAPTFAYVGLPLRDTLNALKRNAATLGLQLDGEDYEGVEAELELSGDPDDVSVQLKPAMGCAGVTRVERTNG